MLNKNMQRCFKGLGVAIAQALTYQFASAIILSANCAIAQITPDSTLSNNSNVRLEGNTRIIEGGTRAGSNLFHSFTEFSVPSDTTAFFKNSADVQNILTRVTGSARSNIDGIIKANDSASLFLINPNGIIFGPNARLDIGGSFIGSTAEAIGFGSLGHFSATNPEAASPLLTINPSALLFSQIQRSSIETSSVASDGRNLSNALLARGLGVDDGKSLLLVGGDVSVNGGGLYAFGGRVELGGLAGVGTVGLNGDAGNFSLSFPDGIERSDISLSNNALVNVRAGNGGSIAINARNLEMTKNSQVLAGIESRLGSDNSRAGNIEVNAQGTLNLKDSSNITNSVQSEATGLSGDINITTSSLTLSNDAELRTSTFGQGSAGNVNIKARERIDFDRGYVFTTLQEGAIGKSGDINITTGSLALTNGAELVATTYGRGSAGNVNINARDTVSFDGVGGSSGTPSGAFTNVESQNAVGNGGVININTGSLYLSNGAIVNARTRGQGDGGSVNIIARETVSFDRSNAISLVGSTGVGFGGNISIDTSFLTLANGAQLRSSTYGQGSAGNVNINARDRIDFDRGYVFTTLQDGARGKSGDINITTGSLALTNGAELVATTYGRGSAGNVNINARDTVSFDGKNSSGFPSGAFSNVESQNAVGNGGDIKITTGSLYLSNGAIVNTRTLGQGNGGNVNINARETVSFDRSDAISSVESTGVGFGGDISIDTSFLTLANGAELSTSTSGQGSAGNVNIKSRETVSFDRSDAISLVGSTGVGFGGDISIDTSFLTLANGAQLRSSTFGQGSAGSVNINARDRIDFDRGYVFSTLEDGASGKSGNINITTGSLALTNGAELVATTYGRGSAGNVIINARDTVRFDGVGGSSRTPSGAFTNVESQNAVGNGGDININTGSLYLSNGAIVQARTRGQGNGGNVNINARETVSFDRSDAISSVESTGVGFGGDINITTGLLEILNGAELRATTEASNNAAGNIDVAANSIRLDQGTISADTTAGQGNINLRSRDLILLRRSNITTGARGSQVIGGNIDINTDVLALLQNSNITANSLNSRGGNINIKTQGLFRSLDSSITATGANNALSGNVNITTLADPSKDLVPLTVDVVDVARLVDDNICARTAKSSFTVTGRGGIADSPDNPAVSNFSWEDWRLLEVSKQQTSVTVRNTPISNTSSPISNQIVEARGWVIDFDGSVILTAAYPVSLSQNNLLSQCQ